MRIRNFSYKFLDAILLHANYGKHESQFLTRKIPFYSSPYFVNWSVGAWPWSLLRTWILHIGRTWETLLSLKWMIIHLPVIFFPRVHMLGIAMSITCLHVGVSHQHPVRRESSSSTRRWSLGLSRWCTQLLWWWSCVKLSAKSIMASFEMKHTTNINSRDLLQN